LTVARNEDDLCEMYPEKFQRYYWLVPSIENLPLFLEWAKPRHRRVHEWFGCWTADGLSEFEEEWLADHGVDVSSWVKELFDEDLRDDDD